MSRKLRALVGTAVVVVGGLIAGPAAPASAATSCLNVPATTPGFTVGIGGTPQRIPAFSGISVCASTPDGSPVAPVVSNAVGGACVASCTTVSLQVSPLDLGPLSVTYVQDGVTNRQTVDPQAVGTSQGVCLVSIGTPQAPVPSCAVSLGSDQDLTATVAGLVSQVTTLVNQTIAQVKPIVDDAIADAVALANQLGPQAKAIVDDAIADAVALANQLGPQAQAIVDDAVADAVALANQLGPQAWQGVCWVVYWDHGVTFCDDPVQWAEIQAEYTSNWYIEYLTDPALVQRLRDDAECIVFPDTCWY